MRKDRGAALLLVILLVAILSIVVVEFQREVRVELRSAVSLADDLQAHALLRSGAEIAAYGLTISAAQSIQNLKIGMATMPGAQFLGDLIFAGKRIESPFLPQAIAELDVSLGAQLVDVYGKFPLGALIDPPTAVDRQLCFKEFLDQVKQYLRSQEIWTLDDVDTDALKTDLVDYLSKASDPKDPMESLAELAQVDGFTPEVIRALTPYVDPRPNWVFNINGLSVPMIMEMTNKPVEDAKALQEQIQSDPADNAGASPLGSLSATRFPPASLVPKSEEFELFLEAEVRGVKRRAKGVLQHSASAPAGQSNQFKLVGWAEGWVEDWPVPASSAQTAGTTSSSTSSTTSGTHPAAGSQTSGKTH
jgi:type II secretory pathway component PulK